MTRRNIQIGVHFSGRKQSPVNVSPNDLVFDPKLGEITWAHFKTIYNEMNEGLRAQHEDLISASAFISDSLNMFETTRRRVYVHMGYDYPIVTPGLATRSAGALWCTLVSSCRECNWPKKSQGQQTNLRIGVVRK